MGNSITALASGAGRGLWIDFYDYAGNLLSQGRVPWLDQARFADFHGKAQGLLKSSVVTLPLVRVIEALLDEMPELAAAMRLKSRPGFPLRRLLQETALRDVTAALLQPLRLACRDNPLVLALPSPARMLTLAFEIAHEGTLDPAQAESGDEIEAASVYLADFLRVFAESGLDAILLDEGEGGRAGQDLDRYEPILNKAQHYRWEVGLKEASVRGDGAEGFDFRLAPGLPANVVGANVLGDEFWSRDVPVHRPAGQLLHVTIPVSAMPEAVLSRLGAIA